MPPEPRLYHICHVDRLESIVRDQCLWSHEQMQKRQRPGTIIGFGEAKERRLYGAYLSSHPGLRVGQCVPFYFSVRPPMLHVIHRRDPALDYKGGQDPIVYLEADLRAVVAWADSNARRWAFTTGNAAAAAFEDFGSLDDLDNIDWRAVHGRNYRREFHRGKQAEFLIEWSFPWELVRRVCVHLPEMREQVYDILKESRHKPAVELAPGWYFGCEERSHGDHREPHRRHFR